MATVANDTASADGTVGGTPPAHPLRSGLLFALVSAVSFGLSGALAAPLMAAGWSPGAVVGIRIGVGGVALIPFAVRDLGGWSGVRRLPGVLREHGRIIVLYGLLAITAAQFCYFSAIQTMDVGPALLIEYTAPVVVVCWMWIVHHQRPSRWAFAGIAIAAVGLILVLDLLGGASVSPVGALWAGGAMIGAAGYFLISANTDDSLPASVLATGGMIFAAVLLAFLGAVRLLPMTVGGSSARFADFTAPAWLVLLMLALITAATAYLTGIAAARRLGARLASLCALIEVLAAVIWAAALLGQIPSIVQIVGGVLIVLGVVAAKLGEGEPDPTSEPVPTVT